MSDRPWTSGPWSFEWWQHPEKPWWNPRGRLKSGDKTIVEEGYYCEDDVFDWSESDASLIALAPEMAEALLKIADCPDCDCSWINGEGCDFCSGAYEQDVAKAVVDKLRAIPDSKH